MAKSLKEWLDSGLHMPSILRDFHAQKDVFKLLHRSWVAQAQKEKPEDHMVRDLPNWIAGHIYVIDYFLRFMAIHGYTLQRAEKRSGFSFEDLPVAVQRMRDEEAEVLRSFLSKAEEEKTG